LNRGASRASHAAQRAMVASVAPWRRMAPAEKIELNIVTKDKFLAVFVHMQANAEKEETKEVLTPAACPASPIAPRKTVEEVASVVAPAMTIAAPPGLDLPDELPELVKEHKAASEATTPPEGYQVLLRDVPKLMTQMHMMCATLEQAALDGDVMALDFRPGGKVLITFSTFQSMHQCILHFNGRPWSTGGACISALHVRTMKKANGSDRTPDVMSASAPAFVPTSKLSAAADVFVPSSPEKVDERDRFISDVSTQASPLSSPNMRPSEDPWGIEFGELEFELTQLVV